MGPLRGEGPIPTRENAVPQPMAIHYLMMGMERDQVWWGGCIGQPGTTLDMDLHFVGPGASKIHPNVLF